MEQSYPFSLPPLPYPYDALEPELDARTLHFHHDKHFLAYIEKLNQLLAPYPAFQDWSLEALCLNWSALPGEIQLSVRDNAGGVFHHDLYFRTLHPLPPTVPAPPLQSAIARTFGDLSQLRSALKSAALSVFGSGWACLCAHSGGDLTLQKTANQNTALPLTPLLCCDVWEHAYYLQYQNRRGDYFDAWWRLINWPEVSRTYAALLENRPPRPQP